MDISVYWKAVKAQSKILTGVKKIDAGVFHKSGIGSSLESYIKAVGKGKVSDIQKTAVVAHKKCTDYLTKIHAKEMTTGKKAMTAPQLKSAKIVGDALDKIVAQLADVISGKALAGSFDGDGGKDAQASSELPDRKLGLAAQAHIDLRNLVEKEAKKFLAMYQSKASPVAGFVKIGLTASQDAPKTKKEGDTFNNMQSMSNAQRAVDEISDIIAEIQKHYDKNVSGNGSNFMKARLDFSGKDKLPPKFRVTYMKEHNAAWSRAMIPANEINALLAQLKGAQESANGYLDVCESYSMQHIDPSKLIGKLKKIEAVSEKTFSTVDLAYTRVGNVPTNVAKIMDMSSDKVAKAKGIKLREDDAKKRIQQVVDGNKQAQQLRKRIQTIAGGAEDSGVLTAAVAAAAPLDKIDVLLKAARTTIGAAQKALSDANDKLSELV